VNVDADFDAKPDLNANTNPYPNYKSHSKPNSNHIHSIRG